MRVLRWAAEWDCFGRLALLAGLGWRGRWVGCAFFLCTEGLERWGVSTEGMFAHAEGLGRV
jgi:hypothetical protein